jgi:hypothetical protein
LENFELYTSFAMLKHSIKMIRQAIGEIPTAARGDVSYIASEADERGATNKDLGDSRMSYDGESITGRPRTHGAHSLTLLSGYRDCPFNLTEDRISS